MSKETERKPVVSSRNGATLPNPGPGRPKGSVNKFTSLKQSFLNVFQQMGGDEALLEWAKTHKAIFYQMITKLFPQEIHGDPENPINFTLAVKVIKTKDE